jgi:hypothetical protein
VETSPDKKSRKNPPFLEFRGLSIVAVFWIEKKRKRKRSSEWFW